MRQLGAILCGSAVLTFFGSATAEPIEPAIGHTLIAAGTLAEQVRMTERWWWGVEPGIESRGRVEDARMELDWATLELLEGVVVVRQPVADSPIRQVLFEGRGRVAFATPSPRESRHASHVLAADDLVIDFERALIDWIGPLELQTAAASGPELRAFDRARFVLTQRAHHGSAARLAAAAAHGEAEYRSALLEYQKRYLHISYDPLRMLEYTVALGSATFDKNTLENYDFCEVSAFHARAEYASGDAPRHPRPLSIDGISAAIETEVREDRSAVGSATLRLQAFRDGPRAIRLHLRPSLSVSAVTEKGGAPWGAHQAAVFESWHKYLPAQDDDLWIYPARHIAAGEEFEVQVDYQGDGIIEERAYGGNPRYHLYLDDKKMIDQGGAFFYVSARDNWYPRVGEWDDSMTFELVYRAPELWRVVASGVEQSREKKDGVETSRWSSAQPERIAGFNLGPMRGATVERERVSISAYHQSSKGMKGVAEDLQNAYQVYSHYFGAIERNQFNASHQPAGFSQSLPSLVYLDLFSIERSRSSRQADAVVLHEMAHQWFGHEIRPLTPADRWLSEGTAEYASWIALQVIDGEERRLLDQAKRARQLLLTPARHGHNMSECGPISFGTRLIWFNEHQDEGHYSPYAAIVYQKGAYVMHMLRMMLYDFSKSVPEGDARFVAMMCDFIERHRGGTVATEDFIGCVSRHFGEPMQWFFDQWVYGTEIPKVRFDHDVEKTDAGKFAVDLEVRMEKVADGFRLRVPFVMHFGKGQLYAGTIDAVAPKTRVTKIAPIKPKEVQINPWGACLVDD